MDSCLLGILCLQYSQNCFSVYLMQLKWDIIITLTLDNRVRRLYEDQSRLTFSEVQRRGPANSDQSCPDNGQWKFRVQLPRRQVRERRKTSYMLRRVYLQFRAQQGFLQPAELCLREPPLLQTLQVHKLLGVSKPNICPVDHLCPGRHVSVTSQLKPNWKPDFVNKVACFYDKM